MWPARCERDSDASSPDYAERQRSIYYCELDGSVGSRRPQAVQQTPTPQAGDTFGCSRPMSRSFGDVTAMLAQLFFCVRPVIVRNAPAQ